MSLTLLAAGAAELLPVMVFFAIMASTWWILNYISNRNSQAEERLERLGRPKSMSELDVLPADQRQRFSGLSL